MNVDQNSSTESLNRKVVSPETELNEDKKPDNNSSQTSSDDNTHDIQEVLNETNSTSGHAIQEIESILSLHHCASKDEPKLVFKISKILSETKVSNEAPVIPSSSSGTAKLDDATDSPPPPFKILSTLTVRSTEEPITTHSLAKSEEVTEKTHQPDNPSSQQPSIEGPEQPAQPVTTEQPQSTTEAQHSYSAPKVTNEGPLILSSAFGTANLDKEQHPLPPPFKILSTLNIRSNEEPTTSRSLPELRQVTEMTPQTDTSSLKQPSTEQPEQPEQRVIVEQPRSTTEAQRLYLAPNALRESESHVQVSPVLGNLNNPLRDLTPNVPPSYSTVIKFPPPEIRRNFPYFAESNFSFSTRVPPPSYGQVQGLWTESSSTRSSEDVLYGPEPQYAECPRCTVIIITETRAATSKLTHFTAVGLCLLGCWPCCLLPYFMESCKDTYHYCPLCHHCFGLYSPW